MNSKKTKEAIILAGGLGTRLKGVISEIPKPMAPIADKPFLSYLLSSLVKWEITSVTLSVGYKFEIIKKYFGNSYKGMKLNYVVEEEPLGTGGAISLALKSIKADDVIILNGDTFIDVNIEEFVQFCNEDKSDFGLVLKQMNNFDRYGTVQLNGNRVIKFNEKKAVKNGIINCGVYYLNKKFWNKFKFPEKYSFEKEFLEKYFKDYNFTGYVCDGYFIDIGIPEDFVKAQIELPTQINN